MRGDWLECGRPQSTFLADGFPKAHRGSPSLINLYTPTPPETHATRAELYQHCLGGASPPLAAPSPPLAASSPPLTGLSFPVSSCRQPLGSGLFHCLPIFSPLDHLFFFWRGSGVHSDRFCLFYPAYLGI